MSAFVGEIAKILTNEVERFRNKSDRLLSESEKEVIEKICRVLNLNTSEAVCIDPSP